MQDGSFQEASIPVYEVDGKTVVGSQPYSFGLQFIPTTARSEYAVPPYPVNENGQTYGSMAFVSPNNPTPPDLVACMGIDGTEGYCYNTDLNAGQPNNPEEAIEYMRRLEERHEEMRRTGEEHVRTIPLYAYDGVTIIGEFGIGSLDESETHHPYVADNATHHKTHSDEIIDKETMGDTTTDETGIVDNAQTLVPQTGGGKITICYNEHPIYDVTIKVGDSVRLSYNAVAGRLGERLRPVPLYESSNEAVFIVEQETGEITGVGHGVATFTVTLDYTTENGKLEQMKAECIIRVK
jgi:hypothetical protein